MADNLSTPAPPYSDSAEYVPSPQMEPGTPGTPVLHGLRCSTCGLDLTVPLFHPGQAGEMDHKPTLDATVEILPSTPAPDERPLNGIEAILGRERPLAAPDEPVKPEYGGALYNQRFAAPDERDATIGMLRETASELADAYAQNQYARGERAYVALRTALTNTESAARAYRERVEREARVGWIPPDAIAAVRTLNHIAVDKMLGLWVSLDSVIGLLEGWRNTPANSERAE